MTKSPRQAQGIVVSNKFLRNKTLSLLEKVLLVEIYVRAHRSDGVCRSSNQSLAEFLNIGERQIRRYLAALKKRNYITIAIEKGNQRIIQPVDQEIMNFEKGN